MAKKLKRKDVETIKHDEAKRKNIPTAEFQSVMKEEERDGRMGVGRINFDLSEFNRRLSV